MAARQRMQTCDRCGKKVKDLSHHEATDSSLCPTCLAEANSFKPASTDPRASVDVTRKTPWGTQYRVVRAEVAGIESNDRWAVICLDHEEHVTCASMKPAFMLGTKGNVAEWCASCEATRDGKPLPRKRTARKQ